MSEETDTKPPTNEGGFTATCGSAIGAARDVAITMSYDAMRCCLGQKTQHHTLDDVQRWMTAVHDGYHGPSRGDLEAAARNWRDRYARAESDGRAADEDSERLASAIRDWMASQGIARGSGSILDDALDSHECRKPDAPTHRVMRRIPRDVKLLAALKLAHGWMGDGHGKETNPVSFTSDIMLVEEILRDHETFDGQNAQGLP